MYRHLKAEEIALEYQHVQQIREAFSELEIDDFQFNDEGMFNDIVTVNDDVIFRFPKYDWVREDMEQEKKCLRIVRSFSDIPVPDWIECPGGFIRYAKLPGTPLSRDLLLHLPQTAQERAAEQIAQFLADMHKIPSDSLKTAEIRHSVIYRSYNEWLEMFDEIQQEMFPYLHARNRQKIEDLFHHIIGDNTFLDAPDICIHGDLQAHHILCSPETGDVQGIIDFSSSGLGDPAYDIAMLISQYGESFAALVARFYPDIAAMIDRARFHAQTFPLQWALGGLRTHDPYWYFIHLNCAADMFPIGTPLNVH